MSATTTPPSPNFQFPELASIPFPSQEATVDAHNGSTTIDSSNSPKRINISEMNTTKFAALGSLMIVAMETMLFPLNTIQTILMSQRTTQKSKSLVKTIRHVVKTEGVVRLWRGILPQTMGALPGQAGYYVAYETVNERVGVLLGDGQLNHQTDSSSSTPFLRGFLAGACADVVGGIFYVPADIVAQRLQIQNSQNLSFSHNKRLYKGGFDVCRKIVQQEGIFGFWRGYVGYVTAFAPASAVQWGVYELCKMVLYPVFKKLNSDNVDALVTPVSGGIAGFCAICANNPLEVMRVRLQVLESRNKQDAETIRRGYWQLGLSIYKKEGPRGI
ncbi:mitochondrial carrier domain-containing protein [Obelidium mucronatum]|nr:mitochondrial carrier domain-containing protein [Obelidium mucronatum]